MAKQTSKMWAYIYTRVSSKEQLEGYSLESQEHICREWCAFKGYGVRRVFTELGESAKTTHRTELNKMLACIESYHSEIGVIVTYKLDRLTRNTRDFLDLRDCAARYGIELKYATQNFEDTPEGRYQEVTTAARAQCDNEERGDRCKLGLVSAVEDGRFCWVAPLGYRNGGTRSGPSLVVENSQTADLIKKAFQLVDSGLSSPKALHELTLEGLRTRRGNVMCHKSFFEMLTNKAYMGYVCGCGRTVRGDWAPIVDEELFARVQLRLHRTSNTAVANYHRVNPEFPLRSTIRCPRCGCLLTASNSTGHGGKYGYYSCVHCKHSGVRSTHMEDLFARQLQRLDFKPELVTCLRIALEANLEHQMKWGQKSAQQLTTKLADLTQLRKGALEKCIRGVISDEVAREYVSDLEQQMADVKQQMEAVRDSVLVTDDVIKTGLAVLGDMGSFWRNANVTAKQEFQRFLFPAGTTVDDNGFGTSETALCIKQKEIQRLVERNVVAAGGFEPSTLRV